MTSCGKLRTGAPWRDLPERYSPWQTCYERFVRWRRDGTWHRLLSDLQTKSGAVGEVEWVVSVDSTVASKPSTSASVAGLRSRQPPTYPPRIPEARRLSPPGLRTAMYRTQSISPGPRRCLTVHGVSQIISAAITTAARESSTCSSQRIAIRGNPSTLVDSFRIHHLLFQLNGYSCRLKEGGKIVR